MQMNIDIVSRLRDRIVIETKYQQGEGCADLLEEAAEVIEQLRIVISRNLGVELAELATIVGYDIGQLGELDSRLVLEHEIRGLP